MTGEAFPKTPAVREALDEAIEALIALRDVIDDDPDLEDEPDREEGGDAEPSLGWTDMGARYGHHVESWVTDAEHEHDGREPDVDDEDGHDAEEDSADAEPALGWNASVGQLRLTAHEDGETSLGWANGGSQLRLHAEGRDGEFELDDTGIGDNDGLLEQMRRGRP